MAAPEFSADSDATNTTDASDWRSALGRFGLAARGVLYLSLGTLALQLAFGASSSQQVSDSGAISFIEQQPAGTIILWVLALGLVSLALWQFTTAVTGDPVEGSDASDRAKFAFKGVLYAATAVTAFAALGVASSGGSGGGGGGSSQSQAAGFLLDLPSGQWIVGALGVAVSGYGVYTVWKHAVRSEFMQRLATRKMGPGTEGAVEGVGRAGYGARGTVIAIAGVFFIVAAIQHSPDSTRGLGGALLALSQQPYGTWLLAAVAAGLFLYGVFSLAEARYRRAA